MLDQAHLGLARGFLVAAALLAYVGVGCAHGASPKDGAVTTPTEWTPNADEDAVYRALSVRDGGPDCASVEALAKDPVAALVSMVENVQQPPWVAVRAAQCLVRGHAEQVKPNLMTWVVAPQKRGLAILLANEADAMPEAVAVEVARVGLAGPYAEDMRKRLVNSQHASVRALVAPAP